MANPSQTTTSTINDNNDNTPMANAAVNKPPATSTLPVKVLPLPFPTQPPPVVAPAIVAVMPIGP